MTKRVTISISDELAERLEPWRSRINVSRVCAEALAKQVAVLEDLPKEVLELQEVISRLRQEKPESQGTDKRIGFEDGLAFARDCSYRELKRNVQAVDELRGTPFGFELPEDSKADLTERIQDGEVIEAEPYVDGWVRGLMQFWGIVKGKI